MELGARLRALMLWLLPVMVLVGCASSATDANNNKSARVHTELGGLYFERGQYGVALDELEQALRADSNFAPAYSVRGLVNMALRDDKQAEADFRKSLSLDKKDSDTHNNYGWFLCQRGREKESIPHFMSALKNPLYQTPARAFLNAGLCSKQGGNFKDADEFLQRALTIQPGMPQAIIALAELNFATGNFAVAKKYFADYSKNSDNFTAEQLWLAVRIERKMRDRNSEASYSMQLRKRFPDAPETQLLLNGE